MYYTWKLSIFYDTEGITFESYQHAAILKVSPLKTHWKCIMTYNKIENKKLNVRSTRKIGNDIYLPLTGYLEENTKYIVEKRLEKRKLNGEDKILTEIVIQPVDDAKLICQNWNEIKCEKCDTFAQCELNL